MYVLLRAMTSVALRWFYRSIQVEGRERIPRRGPVLFVVNHPNALVDAMLVGWVVPRRVLLTAKATIFRNALGALLLRWVGVVPLRRASDEKNSHDHVDPSRNENTFLAVRQALQAGGAVLIFPEGKSHDEPAMAPLKTGAARMALDAWGSGAAPALAIVPIGLTFERKDTPRTRVFVQVGEPLLVQRWCSIEHAQPVDELTHEIDARLRAVTLNYASADEEARTIRLASTVAALMEERRALGDTDRGLGVDTTIARRIEELSARLGTADPELRSRAEAVVERLEALHRMTAEHRILLEDIGIDLAPRAGLRFTIREGWLLLVAGPVALWGRVNHLIPFRAAEWIAMRSVDSAADPAMRTVVAGAALVVLAYLAQTIIVGLFTTPLVALLYLVSLPLAADVNFILSDRLRRAARRARAFFLLSADADLQLRLTTELALLRAEVLSLDDAFNAARLGTDT
jgi:glycerol-3-phosphate O-acyltransferase / dihydroxyacetone phosphate acyltransferase